MFRAPEGGGSNHETELLMDVAQFGRSGCRWSPRSGATPASAAAACRTATARRATRTPRPRTQRPVEAGVHARARAGVPRAREDEPNLPGPKAVRWNPARSLSSSRSASRTSPTKPPLSAVRRAAEPYVGHGRLDSIEIWASDLFVLLVIAGAVALFQRPGEQRLRRGVRRRSDALRQGRIEAAPDRVDSDGAAGARG